MTSSCLAGHIIVTLKMIAVSFHRLSSTISRHGQDCHSLHRLPPHQRRGGSPLHLRQPRLQLLQGLLIDDGLDKSVSSLPSGTNHHERASSG